jgi:hypothetical protein
MTLNTSTATVAELNALKTKGAEWLCVAAYAHQGHEKGDILSWHKSQNSASRAAKGEFRTIKELHDVLQEAVGYENMMASA